MGTPNISERRHGVNVETVRKSLAQGRRVGHMGEHAQLDLAVIGADQRLAVLGHEGLADLAALRRSHRNVLQVRFLRGEAARGGRGQYVARMHPARVGVDIGGQSVRIRTFELGELPPSKDLLRQVVALGREFLECGGIGTPGAGLGFAAAGQAHLVEQDLAELLRRADIEILACKPANLVLEACNGLRERTREARQHSAVHFDSSALHIAKDRLQRALQRLVHCGDAFGRKPGFQYGPEPQRRVRLFARIFGRAGHLDPVECDGGFAGAQHLFLGEAGMAEQRGDALGKTMVRPPCIQRVGDQSRVVDGPQRDAVARQRHHGGFCLGHDLQNSRRLPEAALGAAWLRPAGLARSARRLRDPARR